MMARRILLTRSNIHLMIASLFLYISVANGTIQIVETGNKIQVKGESPPEPAAAINMHPLNPEVTLDVEETSQTVGGGGRQETVVITKTLRSHDTIEESESEVPEDMTLSLRETVEVVHHDLEPTTAPEVLGGNLENILNGRQYLVATIDGRITLLNRDGTILWTVLTDKSFSSSVSSLDLRDRENGRRVTLIPSLAGSIYRYDGDNLSPMPMNVESLLQRSFTLPNIPNEVTLSGGKELKTYGIDLRTGKIRYECGISGCSSPKTTEDKDASKVTLVVKKQLQTVRAVDSVSGTEKWNFSVGTNEISIAGAVCQGGFQTLLETDVDDDLIRIAIPEGRVHGVDSHSNIMWERDLGSPISEAWLMDRGQLIPIDPIVHNAAMTDPPSLYVGMLNQQFYVQESHFIKEAVSNALVSHNHPTDQAFTPATLGITWKPTREACEDEPTTAITPLGTTAKPPVHFFVFESDRIDIEPADNTSDSILNSPETLPFEEFEDDGLDTFEDIINTDEEPGEITQHVDAVIKSVWHWWKEILGLSLFITVIFNVMFLRPIIRFVRMDTVREMMRSFNVWLESQRGVVEEAAEAMPYETALVPYSGGGGGDRCTSTSSTSVDNDITPRQKKDSFTEFEDTEPVYPFISTYLKEFEPIQCLGKGAFGIVFEAKKKIDDRNYAVKRIALPSREKDRARVMREVKALAQLDHKNIVRYFHAWVENPPKGWLENHDPLWNSNVVNSALPTCDWSSSISVPNKQLTSVTFNSDSFTSSGLRNRKMNFNNSMEDDSFIVFEASNKDLKFEPSKDDSVDSMEADSRMNESVCDTDAKSENVDSNESGVMYLYIQQELCHKRTLQHWLKMEQKRDKMQVMKFFSEIVDAVEYVHAKKLIHRDLKPGNIFLSGSHEGLGEINVKIGDFGLVTSADVLEPQVGGSSADKNAESPLLAKKSKTHFTDNVGTYLYMSPEQSKRKPYDYKVDIFSLGLIFYELLVPFSTDMERYDVLSKVKSLQFSRNFEDLFSEEKSMIEEMISHNPDKRPDATTIKEWIRFQLNCYKLPKNKPKKARDFPGPKES